MSESLQGCLVHLYELLICVCILLGTIVIHDSLKHRTVLTIFPCISQKMKKTTKLCNFSSHFKLNGAPRHTLVPLGIHGVTQFLYNIGSYP